MRLKRREMRKIRELIERKTKKKKEKKISKVYLEERLIYIKCKCIWIGDQEHDEIFQCISSRIPIPIEPLAFVKNMSPQFDWIVVAWTRKVQFWEKS